MTNGQFDHAFAVRLPMPSSPTDTAELIFLLILVKLVFRNLLLSISIEIERYISYLLKRNDIFHNHMLLPQMTRDTVMQ